MPTQLIAKYDTRIPRYTSYPTAPHFHAGITPETFRGWLGGMSPQQELSLYLHVPYCEVICWFCGCHTRGASSYSPVASYREVLRRPMTAEERQGSFLEKPISVSPGDDDVIDVDAEEQQ